MQTTLTPLKYFTIIACVSLTTCFASPNNTLAQWESTSTVQFSPLSPINTSPTGTTAFTAIFRLQFVSPTDELPEIFASERPRLKAVFSETAPTYLNNVTHQELLSLEGASVVPFELDKRAASFANYADMLRIAGLA